MSNGNIASFATRWGFLAIAFVAVVAAELFVFGISAVHAQANVTVAPTRLVFEDRDRSEELVLLNRGSEPVTYRISVIHMHMTEDGRLQRIDEPTEDMKVADDLMRYAPRQVLLEPGVSQRVRVMLRKPPDLAEGEYRSHLLFQAVPTSAPDEEPDLDEEGQLALQLNVISGLSIAAIVRHGQLSAHASIEDLEFVEASDDAPAHVAFALARDGNRSVYGDIDVSFIPENSDEPVPVARRNGTAVYTPNESRKVRLGVELPDDVEVEGGRFVVNYQYTDDDGEEVLATEEVELP